MCHSRSDQRCLDKTSFTLVRSRMTRTTYKYYFIEFFEFFLDCLAVSYLSLPTNEKLKESEKQSTISRTVTVYLTFDRVAQPLRNRQEREYTCEPRIPYQKTCTRTKTSALTIHGDIRFAHKRRSIKIHRALSVVGTSNRQLPADPVKITHPDQTRPLIKRHVSDRDPTSFHASRAERSKYSATLKQ